MLDHEGYQRLAKLVEELTDKKHLDQEPVLLKRFKALCKTSDANIQSSFELLLDRLKAPHAQVSVLLHCTHKPLVAAHAHVYTAHTLRSCSPSTLHGAFRPALAQCKESMLGHGLVANRSTTLSAFCMMQMSQLLSSCGNAKHVLGPEGGVACSKHWMSCIENLFIRHR